MTDIEKAMVSISSAFDGVAFPGPEHKSLFQAEAWDNYETCDQSRDFKGHWSEIPVEHLEQCEYALPHLDEFGMQYYLPALMTAILGGDNAILGECLVESVKFAVRPVADPSLNSYQASRFSLFSSEQRSAVLQFIREVLPDDAPLIAHWKEFSRTGVWG